MIVENISAKQGLFLTDEAIYSCDGSSCYKSNRKGKDKERLDLEDLEGLEFKYNKETLVYVKSNKVKAIYLPTQRVLLEKELNDPVSSFCISPSGMSVSIGFENGKTIIFSNLLGDSLGKFTLFSDGSSVENLDFLDDEMMLGSTKERIVLISLLKKGTIAKISSDRDIVNIYPNRDRLVYTTTSKEFYLVDFQDKHNPKKTMLGKINATIQDIKFSTDNKTLFIATDDSLFFTDVLSKKLNLIKDELKSIKHIALDENNSLYIAQENSFEFIINPFDTEKKTIPVVKPPRDKNIIRFLTVDDSKIIRLIIKKSILNNFKNVEVDEAEDGIEALEFLKRDPDIDVMFLDWNMPNMNGDIVVEEMAKRPELKHIKIIMATTEGGKDKVKQMISKGVTGYLVKPLTAGNVNPLTEKMIEMVKKERVKDV